MQDDQLFAGSIADNIAFFADEPDFEWIVRCAQMASVHDDINGFPMRYNTQIGEMGSSLSGGQQQRIMLARALYKRPRILLLDEATSHLDSARERLVNMAVAELNMTRIVIAHRAETIAAAHRVLSFKDGRIEATS
jgi:ATP-binding cassette subfamily B protein RaxB